MNVTKAMNASLIHSPLFCEYAQRSLVEVLDLVQGQAFSCMTNARELLLQSKYQNKVHQIWSFTLKMIR
jgi:hypothetical protein